MNAALAMIMIGALGVVFNKNVFVKILSVEVSNIGSVLLFVATSYTSGSKPPIFDGKLEYADPIPQAVIITAIVIGFSILSLSVSIISDLVEKLNRENSDDIERMTRD